MANMQLPVQFESFLFSVSFYAFNLEQSKVYRLQDYKHYIKVFNLVFLQASFLGQKAAQTFTHTLTERCPT